MDAIAWCGFVAAVFGTSVISGMVGMIGGMVLLVLLGLWVPPAVLIPLHGCLQLMSNGTRVALLLRWVDWSQVGWFALGALVGAGFGWVGVPTLPSAMLSIFLGSGSLLALWLPVMMNRWGWIVPSSRQPGPGVLIPVGGLTTFLSLVVGAVGPLLDAFFVREGVSPRTILGTKAAFQALSHALKVVVYAASGFSLGVWGWALLAAFPATLLGNHLGQAWTKAVPRETFVRILRWLVTGLAILVVLSGLQNR